jgi:hypothetical protein
VEKEVAGRGFVKFFADTYLHCPNTISILCPCRQG